MHNSLPKIYPLNVVKCLSKYTNPIYSEKRCSSLHNYGLHGYLFGQGRIRLNERLSIQSLFVGQCQILISLHGAVGIDFAC